MQDSGDLLRGTGDDGRGAEQLARFAGLERAATQARTATVIRRLRKKPRPKSFGE